MHLCLVAFGSDLKKFSNFAYGCKTACFQAFLALTRAILNLLSSMKLIRTGMKLMAGCRYQQWSKITVYLFIFSFSQKPKATVSTFVVVYEMLPLLTNSLSFNFASHPIF